MPDVVISVIKSLYYNMQAGITLGGNLANIEVSNSLRQGRVLVPTFFILFFNVVICCSLENFWVKIICCLKISSKTFSWMHVCHENILHENLLCHKIKTPCRSLSEGVACVVTTYTRRYGMQLLGRC